MVTGVILRCEKGGEGSQAGLREGLNNSIPVIPTLATLGMTGIVQRLLNSLWSTPISRGYSTPSPFPPDFSGVLHFAPFSAQAGGWQESRITRCGRTLAMGREAPSACNNMAAAMRPVSRVSRRTEVSGGHSRDASGLSS